MPADNICKHHAQKLSALAVKLDSMILKGRLGEMMAPRTDAAWTKQMRSVVEEFRQGATEFADEEIETIVDEAVGGVGNEG